MKKLTKLLQLPYTMSLMNWAAIAGLYYYINREQDFWDLAQPHTNANTYTPRLRGL